MPDKNAPVQLMQILDHEKDPLRVYHHPHPHGEEPWLEIQAEASGDETYDCIFLDPKGAGLMCTGIIGWLIQVHPRGFVEVMKAMESLAPEPLHRNPKFVRLMQLITDLETIDDSCPEDN